jgi:hypothetical protein
MAFGNRRRRFMQRRRERDVRGANALERRTLTAIRRRGGERFAAPFGLDPGAPMRDRHARFVRPVGAAPERQVAVYRPGQAFRRQALRVGVPWR